MSPVGVFYMHTNIITLNDRYLASYERGNIKLTLEQWPAIFYDESLIENDDELAGLFRGETLVRVRRTRLVISLS